MVRDRLERVVQRRVLVRRRSGRLVRARLAREVTSRLRANVAPRPPSTRVGLPQTPRSTNRSAHFIASPCSVEKLLPLPSGRSGGSPVSARCWTYAKWASSSGPWNGGSTSIHATTWIVATDEQRGEGTRDRTCPPSPPEPGRHAETRPDRREPADNARGSSPSGGLGTARSSHRVAESRPRTWSALARSQVRPATSRRPASPSARRRCASSSSSPIASERARAGRREPASRRSEPPNAARTLGVSSSTHGSPQAIISWLMRE